MTKTRAMPPDRFEFERSLAARGVAGIAGVDEAGRGPLAGPVVAAAVIFPSDWIQHGLPPELAGLNDSKRLTENTRRRYFDLLTSASEIRFAVASVDSAVIDGINILQATHRAMNQALAQLQPPPAHVLVDGLRVKSIAFPQTPIIKGDARSYSIAAASVLAKVTRDVVMLQHHGDYPAYGFDEHKGYATPGHLAAIARFGPCPIHRRSFAPIRRPEPELFPPT